MPMRKSRLNREDRSKYSDAAQGLKRAGLIPEIPREWLEYARALKVELDALRENVLLDLGLFSRISYYAVWVHMIAERSKVTLLHHEFATDWDDQIELVDVGLRDHLQMFRWLGFDKKEVLNSRFETPVRFHERGHVIEGWLVAAGSRPVPREFRNDSRVGLQLTFWDQFDNKIGAEADLFVRRPKQKTVLPRTGLFDATGNRSGRGGMRSNDMTERLVAPGTALSLDGEKLA
jgi:hypothetical protein